MGYRSEYQLLVMGPKDDVKAFLAWMVAQRHATPDSVENGDFYSKKETWAGIMGDECHNDEEDGDGGQQRVAFSHDHTKCYPPWDSVIDEIEAYCNKFDLDFAYGRLGERVDDIELRCNEGGLYVSYSMSLTEPFSEH